MLRFILISKVKLIINTVDKPDVNKHPNTYHWYMFMFTFSTGLLQKWIEKSAPKEKGNKGDKGDRGIQGIRGEVRQL